MRLVNIKVYEIILCFFVWVYFLNIPLSTAQSFEDDSLFRDTTVLRSILPEVSICAYEQQKKLSDQPAAISYISSQSFNRYSQENIVSAMNAVPGVQMDLRSPGSVRLNIRGSSIRSPFGVRNVKIYYNGMPLTDPGGNTYLNQLSFNDYGSIEIIKGPSGGMYGAGLGGVMVIGSPLFLPKDSLTNAIDIYLGGGSFGMQKGGVAATWWKNGNGNELRYSDLKSNGYRNHTRLRHQTASYATRLKINKQEELDAFFHFTNLYYQTPGALTKTQYEQNPKSARFATSSQPSAEDSKASVHQKAFFTGIKHTYRFTQNFQNTTILYGSYTDFINPTTRNYEYRKEPHFGGRTIFQFQHNGKKVLSKYWIGAEIQQGYFGQKDFGNNSGRPDTLQIINNTNSLNALTFIQEEWTFSKGWDVSATLSFNHQELEFTSLYPGETKVFNKSYPLVISPRFALSKKINNNILLYLSVSHGFSPPTVAEILPSTNILNKHLRAEQGLSYELGSKGYLFHKDLYFEIDAFWMHLTESISQRRDSSGADYFVNAGGVVQKGIELSLRYAVYKNENTFIQNILAWMNQTIFDFKYRDYSSNGNDYSDNKLPGTAPYRFATGVDIHSSIGLGFHTTFQHSSKIPLNDKNTVLASSYNLLGVKFNYTQKISKQLTFKLSAGGDNLLNEKYSLGNDVNAFGGRYYNAAPTVNFYTKLSLNINF